MSTTEEKIRALEAANTFLVDLLNSKTTPRVPMAIRVRAQRILRHMPIKQDINEPLKPHRLNDAIWKQVTGKPRPSDEELARST